MQTEKFRKIEDESTLSRFNENVRDKIRVLDLNAEGLSLNDIGGMYAFGQYCTASLYNDGTVGSDSTFTMGIYLDDGMSYVTLYGNILINCHGVALYLGGGRSLDVRNNLVVGDCIPINYDNRNVLYGRGDPGITDNMMQIKASVAEKSGWEQIPYNEIGRYR